MGRPHGMDGSFHVTRPEPFEGDIVTIAGTNRRIVRRFGTDAKPVLRVFGIDSREAAQALRGEPIIGEMTLEEGEWWAEDLVGLRAVDGEREVGVVERVVAYPSCDVLLVGDLLIPLIDDAVGEVDFEAGTVQVHLGFLGAG